MPKFVFDDFTQACHMTRTFNTQVSTGGLGTTLGTVIILWSNKLTSGYLRGSEKYCFAYRVCLSFDFDDKLNMLYSQWGWGHLSLYILLCSRHCKVWLQQRSYWANLSQKTICLFKSFQGSTWSIKPYICHTLVNISVQQSEFSLPRIK